MVVNPNQALCTGESMSYKKISAIIRRSQLEPVEKRLQDLGIPGVSVIEMKGFGEFANFVSRKDWFSRELKIEIFTCEESVERIIDAIFEAAHTGGAGDGIIAVLPVDEIYRIRTRSKVSSESLGCRDV